MFSESADLYDAIYLSAKDYDAETRALADLLRELRPGLASVLDVACGTGLHAERLAALELAVDGVDLDGGLLERARARHPGGRFLEGDMADFDLGRRYDAVVCLFSAIGYVRTLPRLRAAVSCMARHLEPGGVVVVEPWFAPGAMTDGFVTSTTVEAGGRRIVRMSRTVLEGRISRLEFEYLIGSAAGLERRTEVHELGLFTREETEDAFARAGLTAEFREPGLSGRGLFVGRS